jgi:hypothetical protein
MIEPSQEWLDEELRLNHARCLVNDYLPGFEDTLFYLGIVEEYMYADDTFFDMFTDYWMREL